VRFVTLVGARGFDSAPLLGPTSSFAPLRGARFFAGSAPVKNARAAAIAASAVGAFGGASERTFDGSGAAAFDESGAALRFVVGGFEGAGTGMVDAVPLTPSFLEDFLGFRSFVMPQSP
jgi:hypothetical protein